MTDKLLTEPGKPDGSSSLEGLAIGGKVGESKKFAMICVNVLELLDSLDLQFPTGVEIQSSNLPHYESPE